MKLRLLGLFLLISSSLTAQIVTEVKITFFTPEKPFGVKGDDKDDDTHVQIGLWDIRGNVRVYCNTGPAMDPAVPSAGPTVQFDDKNTNNDIIYQINYPGAPILRKDDFVPFPQKFSVKIFPNGRDTWVFIPTLHITFSDGSSYQYQAEQAMLTESRPAAVFAVK